MLIKINLSCFFILTFSIFSFSEFSLGWADHHLITKEILRAHVNENLKVNYEPLTSFLSSTNFENVSSFKNSIQINKNYEFKNILHEESVLTLSVLEILSTYSDEPDWGMDQELFKEDQYPELWRSEYSMMGGKAGLSSQAFRHMYWRELYWKHPIQSFKLPLEKINEPMGEAHNRAQLFMNLAQQAFTLKHNYWGWRFVANSLHYIEDVAQPFHSSQVPSKIMINMVLSQCLSPYGCKDFIGNMTNIIAYYHFAYEDTLSYIFHKKINNDKDFTIDPDPIYSLRANNKMNYVNLSPAKITVLMSELANSYSARAGRASISFFPFFLGSYANLDSGSFMNEKWWITTTNNLKQDSFARRNYLNNINSMFYELGDAVRCWIDNVTAPK